MQIGTTVGTVALNVLNGLVDVFKWLVEHPDIITIILGIVAAFKGFSIINNVMQQVSTLGKTFSTVFSGLSSGLSAPLLGIIAVVALVVYTIITHFDELKASLTDTFSKFSAVYDEYIAPFVETIKSTLITLWNEHLKPLIDNLSELIMMLWNDILKPVIDWLIENVLPILVPIFESLWNTISQVIGFIADAINGVVNVFKGVIEFIAGVFSGDWNKAWQGIKDFFSGIWDTIKGIIQAVWSAISGIIETGINVVKGVISTVLNSIKTVWNNVWNGLKTTVTNIFNGIWNSIKGVINSILGGIENMANGVIKGINFVIKALNNLSFDIPDWVPGLGGKKFGFNIGLLNTVSLPRLEKGNVAYEETLAIMGEYSGANQNPEITTPQNVMRETFEDVFSDYVSNNGNVSSINLTVNVGNRKLGEILLEDLRDRTRQSGKNIEALVGG